MFENIPAEQLECIKTFASNFVHDLIKDEQGGLALTELIMYGHRIKEEKEKVIMPSLGVTNKDFIATLHLLLDEDGGFNQNQLADNLRGLKAQGAHNYEQIQNFVSTSRERVAQNRYIIGTLLTVTEYFRILATSRTVNHAKTFLNNFRYQ